MAKMTGADTHRATARGYAVNPDNGAGVLVEAGDMVPADIPVSDEWMEPVKKSDRALAGAIEEATDPLQKDVDYTQLSKAALEAVAAERGVNVKGLSKDDLIAAIKAADEPRR